MSGGAARRSLLVAAFVLGVGLVLAPVIFQMFTRAPGGGEMIDAFGPYMKPAAIARYQGYMTQMDQADKELTGVLPGLLQREAGIAPADLPARAPSLAQFTRQWPVIRQDMNDDMLVKMQHLVPNYEAVAALPPFRMFPWFFVVPGLLVAVTALVALRRTSPSATRRPLVLLAVLGVGIALAPVAFQMFSRAPMGERMITSFEPMMTTERVTTVQGYFIVIGAAEGQLRTELEPLLLRHLTPQELAQQLPATMRFQRDWPHISNDMAPMIGVMADNVSRFQGVDALPAFGLFPWFFVIPGLLVTGCALLAARAAREPGDPGSGEHEPRPARLAAATRSRR